MATRRGPLPAAPEVLSEDQQAQLLACDLNDAQSDCQVELKWGFFFDGTGNNLERDRPSLQHSNVARLHDVFEVKRGQRDRIARYIAGVGTPFLDEVGDQGRGLHQQAGLGAGWGGEARINWALLKLYDNLNYFFETTELNQALGQRDPDTVKRMSRDMKIPIFQLRELEGDDVELLREIATMNAVQTLTATALNTPDDFLRQMVLRERRDHLRSKVERWQAAARPRVSRIRLSVFGFSRGAAEARVFCNWLQDALDRDGSLCGIPLQVDFLGIFDTVASVGMANSSLVFDGHGGWGREADLRVPARVKRCVHVVAAHEVRGSFPLDAFRGDCPSALQLVYPGVHSDIGGGYQVGEQGKGFLGSRGADTAKLSQLPLGAMFNEAVAAGVPLNLEADGLPREWKEAFRVDETLSRAFADYVAADGGRQSGELRALVQDEYGKYLRWRRLRLGEAPPNGLRHQPFVSRARARYAQDAIDLVEANRELAQEAAAMPGRERDPALRLPGDGLRARIDHVVGRMARSFVGVLALRDSVVRALYAEKVAEWREVQPYWDETAALDPRTVAFLDEYVHDSRAWFKPFGETSDEAWRRSQRERLEKLDAQDKRYHEWKARRDEYERVAREGSFMARIGARQMLSDMNRTPLAWPDPVQGEDLAALQAWRADPTALPFEESGREPWSLFGYLRWRTIYEDRASLLARAGESVEIFIENQKEAVRDARDGVLDRARDAANEAVGDAVDAGKRYLIRRIREAIPRGIPTLR